MFPCLWIRPGMIPILHFPGEIIPGQFGPISRVLEFFNAAATRTMSIVGMPSVMQTTSGTHASIASRIASAANGGGTKIIDASAPVSRTASETVLNTCTFSCFVPPLPGVTPAITLLPYSIICCAWKLPSRPVRPCTTTRVLSFTSTLIAHLLQAPLPFARHPSYRSRSSTPIPNLAKSPALSLRLFLPCERRLEVLDQVLL